jgi:hypothetical protein
VGMEVKRRFERFDPLVPISGYFALASEVTGEFANREEFLLKNISVGSLNLISNFSPAVGNAYKIFINYGQGKHDFAVRIIHSLILRFQKRQESVFKAGVLYSSGCEIVYENEAQKTLVLAIIKNDCGSPPPASPGRP